MAIGVYARISKDDGLALGVARQEKDCVALAKLRGWPVAFAYVDNDVSAFKAKVVRPEFERMLADLTAGTIDGVVVYDLDRFARQPSDLERAITVYDSRPGLMFATVQGDLDLASADGRTLARVMVAFANKSSMDTSRRVKRKHAEIRDSGGNVGGTRPFGWLEDKCSLHPVEAPMLRAAALRLLAGDSLTSISREWNAKGIVTPRGNTWTRTTLVRCVMSPRIAGWRVHGTEDIARDDAGRPIRGVWQPILTQEEWLAVCALKTRNAGSRPAAHRYLLSGLLICGICFERMKGGWMAQVNRHRYACASTHFTVHGTLVDKQVSDLMRAWMDLEISGTPITPAWQGESDLAAAEDQRAELMAAYTARNLPADIVFPAVKALSDQIDRYIADRAALAPTVISPSEGWDRWSLERQREEIRRLASGFVVRPAERLSQWNEDRLEPLWHPQYQR